MYSIHSAHQELNSRLDSIGYYNKFYDGKPGSIAAKTGNNYSNLFTLPKGAWVLYLYINISTTANFNDTQCYLFGTNIASGWGSGSNGGDLGSKENSHTQIAGYMDTSRAVGLTVWNNDTATFS